MNRWPEVNLTEVAVCLDSQRVPVKESDRPDGGKVPYYGANGQVGWMDRHLFNEPLLLIAEDGGFFDQPERGVSYVIYGPSWVNNHAHVLRPNPEKARLEYLGYFFRHFNFLPYITGTTRSKLTQRDLFKVDVPLPPLPEQERIVRILDEADALRRLRAQAEQRSAELIPAIFSELFDETLQGSKSWPRRTLGGLCVVVGGGTPSTAKSEYWAGSIPWVSPKDMGAPELIDAQEHISEDAIRQSATNLIPPGALLVVTRSGILRHTFPVTINRKPVAINQDLKAFIPQRDVLPDYLLWHLKSRSSEILRLVRVGATVHNLETQALKDLEIPVPPFKLQEDFAVLVAEIRALGAAQASSLKRLDDLFQSLLHRAFQGEL